MRHHISLITILIGLLLLTTIITANPAAAAPAADESFPTPNITPPPPITVTPAPPPVPAGTLTPTPAPPVITQIFHILRFPANTIYDALTGMFERTSGEAREDIAKEVDQWSPVFAEVFQAPSEKQYTDVAKDSLPVAAALAVPIFLLRLAIYHWNRLTGENDSPLRAIGDWITAGVMAVAAGPVIDLMTQAGWWIVTQALFTTNTSSVAAAQFVNSMNIASPIPFASFFSQMLNFGLSLGGLLALTAVLFSFAAATAAMFVIAMLAPPAAVLGAVPQMSWLRSLLLKAATLIALLPIVAGGIFRAGVAAADYFSGGGLLGPLVRLFWLWGAAGLLMSMAGILGKITLGASGEALGKIAGGVKAVAGLAAAAGLVATGIGAAAAPAVAAGATAGTGATTAGAAAAGLQAGTGAASALVPAQVQAMGHLDAAGKFANWSAGLSAAGLHAPAAMARGLASGQQIAAQKAMLQQRAGNLASPPSSPAQIARESSGLADGINATRHDQAFGDLNRSVHQKGGYSLKPLSDAHPQEMGAVVNYYDAHRAEVEQADDPLKAAVLGAGADASSLAERLGYDLPQDVNPTG